MLNSLNNKSTISVRCKNLGKEEYALYIVFVVFLFFVIKYQYFLLTYLSFCDEEETVVTVKMMANGMRLYSDIFNHHGPLTFLSGYLLELIRPSGIKGHRIPILILQLAAISSIYYSRIIKDANLKMLYTVIVSMLLLLGFPDTFGHMYMYQTIAGLMLIPISCLYIIPSIMFQEELTLKRVVFSNFLISSLPFLAITYGPCAFFLFFAALRKDYLKSSLLGIAVGVAFNFAFLLFTGSFSGYIAYHFYLNMIILPHYAGYNDGLLKSFFRSLHSSLLNGIYNQLRTLVLSCSFCICFIKAKEIWRVVLFLIGVLSLLLRAGGFHSLPYFFILLTLPLMALYDLHLNLNTSKIASIIIVLLCILKISFVIPGERATLAKKTFRSENEFSQLAKILTNTNDKILSWSFANHNYIFANRLPASGYFFYLPWQKEYNDKPVLGIKIEPVKDILKNKPKIIYADKWKVWNRYPWDTYAKDIDSILKNNYFKLLNDRPYYIDKSVDVIHVNPSFYYSDSYWYNGIARKEAKFMLLNSEKAKMLFRPGQYVVLHNGEKRKVIKLETNGIYLYVSLDGGIIKHDDNITPNSFKVVDQWSENLKNYALLLNKALLLKGNETYLDFMSCSFTDSVLRCKNSVYFAQSPLILSGEYTQEQFISEIEDHFHKVPIAILPTIDKMFSAGVDDILYNYKLYKVAEFIYSNYRPLCQIDEYAVWATKDRYEELNNNLEQYQREHGSELINVNLVQLGNVQSNSCVIRFDEKSNALIISATGKDPFIENIGSVLNIQPFAGRKAVIKINCTSSVNGRMQLFYTTGNKESYSEQKSVTANVNGDSTVNFNVPVTEFTKIRLDIPENSNVAIQSIVVSDEFIHKLEYGYDGPENKKGNVSYSSFHNYNLVDLPLLWAEKDVKKAINNKIVAELKNEGMLYIIPPGANKKAEAGHYLAVSCTNESDNIYNAYVALGTNNNGIFEEKCRFNFNMYPGKHNYLFRISSEYYWHIGLLNAAILNGKSGLKDIDMRILEGD